MILFQYQKEINLTILVTLITLYCYHTTSFILIGANTSTGRIIPTFPSMDATFNSKETVMNNTIILRQPLTYRNSFQKTLYLRELTFRFLPLSIYTFFSRT